jgi:hypothetical protein
MVLSLAYGGACRINTMPAAKNHKSRSNSQSGDRAAILNILRDLLRSVQNLRLIAARSRDIQECVEFAILQINGEVSALIEHLGISIKGIGCLILPAIGLPSRAPFGG